MRRFRVRNERGSAAVEFAIVLPVLLLLVIGSVEFGRVFFLQNSITNAARVGARAMAIDAAAASTPAAQAAAVADATTMTVNAASVSPAVTSGQVAITAATAGGTTISPASCTPPANGDRVYVTVTVTYPVTQLTGFMPLFPSALTGKASARCDG